MSDHNEKILHSGPEYPHSQNSQSQSQGQPQPQPRYQEQQPHPQHYQHQHQQSTGNSTYLPSPSLVSAPSQSPVHHPQQLQHQQQQQHLGQPGFGNGLPDGSEAQFQYPQVAPSEAQFQQYPQVTAPRETELPEVPRNFTSPPQPIQYYQQPRQFTHPQVMAQPQLHPTAYGQQGGEWQAGLCECTPCSSCLLAWCLPCILVGQTSERIRDPSMQDADLLNSDCLIHGALTCFTGCGWIYALLKRGEIRERYNIQGSGFKDCCVSFWCTCCAVMQQDNEVKVRQQNAAAQPVHEAYQSEPGMQMPPAPAPTFPQQPAEK